MSEIDNTLVRMAQVAQMLKAMAEKGWGRRELTLMGQATPGQLEDVRAILQGRARIEPIVKRWWREGDDVVIPFPNENRSGPELLAQDRGRFGEHLHLTTKELLPKVARMQGTGELVIIPCTFTGATYQVVLDQILASRPELELAPVASVLQLAADDVVSIDGVQIVVGSEPFIYEGFPEVFQWYMEKGKATLWTLATRSVSLTNSPWWEIPESGRSFLLKRKAG